MPEETNAKVDGPVVESVSDNEGNSGNNNEDSRKSNIGDDSKIEGCNKPAADDGEIISIDNNSSSKVDEGDNVQGSKDDNFDIVENVGGSDDMDSKNDKQSDSVENVGGSEGLDRHQSPQQVPLPPDDETVNGTDADGVAIARNATNLPLPDVDAAATGTAANSPVAPTSNDDTLGIRNTPDPGSTDPNVVPYPMIVPERITYAAQLARLDPLYDNNTDGPDDTTLARLDAVNDNNTDGPDDTTIAALRARLDALNDNNTDGNPSIPRTNRATTTAGAATSTARSSLFYPPSSSIPPPTLPMSSQSNAWSRISRLEPIITFITYPVMVVISVITLILVLMFCIFPTIICMTLGICLYYCLREDPIPLSVLLRYMLSPDDDHHEYPSSYALAQRPVIASKLIVRRVLKIEAEAVKDEHSKKDIDYPRRHPFPIKVSTDHSCLHFSEPIVIIEEDPDTQNNSNSNNNHGDTQDDGNGTNITHLPHYQRSEAYTPTPLQLDSNVDRGSSSMETPAPNDEDGNNSIIESSERDAEAVGFEGSGGQGSSTPDLEVGVLQDEEIRIQCDQETVHGAQSSPDPVAEMDPCKIEMTTIDAAEGTATATLEDGGATGADYFGIEAEVRDRGTTCDICLLEYEVGDTVAWSPNLECSHAFHRDCVLDWLVRKPSCPNCRVDFLKGKQDEDV